MSAMSDYSSFTAKSNVFVPDLLRSQAAQFTSWQYYPYSMPQSEAQYQCYQYSTAQSATAPSGNCCSIDLDDYSDWSDDDSAPEETMTKPNVLKSQDVETMSTTFTSPSKTECARANSPNPSTCDPSSDSGGMDSDSGDPSSDSSDKESVVDVASTQPDEECAMSSRPEVGYCGERVDTLKISSLMKLRSAVNWLDGIEEGRLSASVVPGQGFDMAQYLADTAHVPDLRRPARCRGDGATKGHGKVKQVKTQQKKAFGSDKGSDCEKGSGSLAKELPSSEGSWLAQQKARRATAGETKSNEEVIRAMKGILNKLTVEKFKPLCEKLVSCGIETRVHLEILVNEIFEKATTQHHFIDMYADLCALLHTHFLEHPVTDDPKTSLKKILLNGCQSFFERRLNPPENLEKSDEDDRLALERKVKMQMLGNIKFVGALLVRQMLAAPVLFAICQELLTEATAESLESLAALLTVVGPKFDIPEWSSHAALAEVFTQLEGLTKQPTVSARVRFLLKDVLELRVARWQDRKPKKIEAPSTLKQVAHIQAAEEKACAKVNASASRRSHGTTPQSFSYKDEKAGGKHAASLSGVFKMRVTTDATKGRLRAPAQEYRRISSLAGLKRNHAERLPK